MSECEKGSFWEVSVPKTSAAAIFSGDLYIFAKYTYLCSPTGLFQLHLHDVCAHVQVNVPWRNIMGVRKYVNVIAPPHPAPPLRDVTHLQRSMTYVRTWKWTCRGVTSWECASTWTLLPHPAPPHPCVTWHIFNVAWRMCARASERAVA